MDKKHLVAYVDGSCRPNPGYTGYGIHIYIEDKESGSSKKINNKYVPTNIGYIDKTLLNSNNNKDIYPINMYHIVDIYGYIEEHETSNQSELSAVLILFQYLINNNMLELIEGVTDITINLDSMYVINKLEQIMNNIPITNDIPNSKILKKIEKYYKDIASIGYNINLRKVKGHSGDIGNDIADMLSNMGRVLNTKNEDRYIAIISNRKEYWDNKVTKPYNLSTKLLYRYNSSVDNVLQLVNYKEEVDIGRSSNEATYILTEDTDTDDIVTKIDNMIRTVMLDRTEPYVIRLDNIFNKTIYRNIKLYENHYLMVEKKPIPKIVTMDNITVANMVYPPSLSYLADSIFEDLFDALLDIKDRGFTDNDLIKYIDITDMLYTINDKNKQELRKEIINDKYDLYVEYNGVKIPLVLGYDLPGRNILKRMEKMHPKIYLRLSLYTDYLTYETVIDVDNKLTLYRNHYARIALKLNKK